MTRGVMDMLRYQDPERQDGWSVHLYLSVGKHMGAVIETDSSDPPQAES